MSQRSIKWLRALSPCNEFLYCEILAMSGLSGQSKYSVSATLNASRGEGASEMQTFLQRFSAQVHSARQARPECLMHGGKSKLGGGTTTNNAFVELLAAHRVCTDANGDARMRKANTELLEQGIQAEGALRKQARKIVAGDRFFQNSSL